MSEGKIEFHVGNITFVGEGKEEWLSAQLDKILENLGELGSTNSKVKRSTQVDASKTQKIKTEVTNKGVYSDNLSIFLRTQEATSNQRLKFLATSAWLAKNNENHLKTIDVTKALKESRQPSLGNASLCLNRNVEQGYCEKDNDHFFVTPHGFEVFEKPKEE